MGLSLQSGKVPKDIEMIWILFHIPQLANLTTVALPHLSEQLLQNVQMKRISHLMRIKGMFQPSPFPNGVRSNTRLFFSQ